MSVPEARKKLAVLKKGLTLAESGVNVNVYNEDGTVRTDLDNSQKKG